ncbi:MAG TPA: cytochrome c biogenesis protein CcdA [Anaerolineales bacterium]|nr:cytochrome c biogenesis protein CcdA [Anaerolineales bacterium]
MEAILTSVGLGLLATTSPCVLPLYPGFLAYLSGSTPTDSKLRYWLGLFVLLGVLTMMMLLGLLIALLSISVGRALIVLIPLADALLIVLGVLLLLDKNPFKQLPQIQSPLLSHPLANAFVYGLLYGPLTLPCSGPLVVGIFAYSFTVGEVLSKLSVFLWFGIGFGLPLLVLSLLSGALQRQLTRLFAIHSRKINVVGGLLLVSIALYDLWVNRNFLFPFLFTS